MGARSKTWAGAMDSDSEGSQIDVSVNWGGSISRDYIGPLISGNSNIPCTT